MERLFKGITDDELMNYISKCENYNDSGIADDKLQELNLEVRNKLNPSIDNIGFFLSVTTGEIYREAALRWKKNTEIINDNKNEVDEYIKNWESSYLL